MPVPDQAGNMRDVDNGPGGENGPGRRRAGRFVQSGRTAFFPVPVLRTFTTGRTDTFVDIGHFATTIDPGASTHGISSLLSTGNIISTDKRFVL